MFVVVFFDGPGPALRLQGSGFRVEGLGFQEALKRAFWPELDSSRAASTDTGHGLFHWPLQFGSRTATAAKSMRTCLPCWRHGLRLLQFGGEDYVGWAQVCACLPGGPQTAAKL